MDTVKGKLHYDNVVVTLKLPIIIFKEGGCSVVYCPPLDLCGYGITETEAKQSFRVTLDEFFNYSLHKNTLRNELTRLGWTLKKSKKKPMVPPSLSHSLEINENFSRIFNTHSFKKITTSVNIPAIV